MFDKANEALKNWKSLLPVLKPFVRSETKTAVRRKKMNVTTAPNGAVIGVTDPVDNTEISIPYQPACATVLVGQSVWVEWLYDNFSTAIAVAPGNGLFPSSFFAYDSNGIRRASVSDSGNVSVYDANGTRRFLIQSEDSSGHNKITAYESDGSVSWQLYGDGTSTSNPLPINQGGSGNNTTVTLTPTVTTTVGSASATVYRWGNVVQVYMNLSNTSSVSAMNEYVRGSISGIPLPKNTTVGVTYSNGQMVGCSINENGVVVSRVLIGTVTTSRTVGIMYLV